jgi:hypothetical protein
MKPIIRWTIGNALTNASYEILRESVVAIKKLYHNNFEYFICYNEGVDVKKIKVKNVNLIRQNWEDCPIKLKKPIKINAKTNQKLNGSFWKICPPRLSIDTHEIILDNDLIFLKKPKIIESFLSTNNKNLIIEDSKVYLGEYEKLFENKKQGYNSGVIGLCPGYDFEKDIFNNFNLIDNKEDLDYGQEQGLLMYSLYKTNPLIGSAEDFVGIHAEKIYLNSLSSSFSEYELEKIKDLDRNKFIEINVEILERIFFESEVVHFLESNRKNDHKAWKYFKIRKKYLI